MKDISSLNFSTSLDVIYAFGHPKSHVMILLVKAVDIAFARIEIHIKIICCIYTKLRVGLVEDRVSFQTN